MRPWLARLEGLGGASLENLNRLAEEASLRTESGCPVRFVPPSGERRYYEVRVHESGCVETRPESKHDLFNALAWLAFPLTKARINAMHARAMPHEAGRRGRLRDLLTIFDEGGAIVQCDDRELIRLVSEFAWKELFWTRRETVLRAMKTLVIGHAILEKALDPWPGIICKVLFVSRSADADAQAAQWLASLPAEATPRVLPPFPVFGLPGWHPASVSAQFYDDERYFRPVRRGLESTPGVGRAAAAQAEESPGSVERDAG